MYLGCNNAGCEVVDSLIEGNYIHTGGMDVEPRTGGSSGCSIGSSRGRPADLSLIVILGSLLLRRRTANRSSQL